METMVPSISELEELGFNKAAKTVTIHKEIANPELRRKLGIAFEHYRVVEPQDVTAFNEKLRKRTASSKIAPDGYGHRVRVTTFKQLKFIAIGDYPSVPPPEVLAKLKEAQGFKCFDRFEIGALCEAKSEERLPDPDPILFGRVKDSESRFYIAQWDDDVKIEDILKEGQG